MKLTNQLKIVKDHGFKFKRLTHWHRGSSRILYPVYERDGYQLILKKSLTKKGILEMIEDIEDRMRAEDVRNRRRAMRKSVVTGGMSWCPIKGQSRATLKVIEGGVAA